MNILTFDTCFNKSYIALCSGQNVIASKIIESDESNYHSAFLISSIRDILKNNNLYIKDINVIGVNAGPGSFTGIRAGITVARVLAQQFNMKICPVSSLKILSCLNKSDKKTITLLDARKNKFYFAMFDTMKANVQPILIEKSELIEKLDSDSFIVSDLSVHEYLKTFNIESYNYEMSQDNFAIYIANIVNEELKTDNNDFHWAKVKPLYIQPPSITKPKELKNV